MTPTPFDDLNKVLETMVNELQTILPDTFLAIYLQGSFATGDFDENSDVDWLVVIDRALTEAELAALQSMHGRIYDMESPWAQHLEGSYFPRWLLNRHEAVGQKLYYLDNGSRQLVRSTHCNTLVVRWVTREQGITLAGPNPASLIEPVPVEALRHEIRQTMREWGEDIFSGRYKIDSRWAQPFVALSYGRMLHTLATGQIHSKLAGVRWAESALDGRWPALLKRAWQERPFPDQKVRQAADPDEVIETLDFIHFALVWAEKGAKQGEKDERC